MSKSTKPKPHKSGAKKKGKKKGGLKGAAKLTAAKKGLTEQIAKPTGVILGLVASSVASNLLDKIPFLKVAEPVAGEEGKFSIKKLIKPIILVAVGGTGIALTHGKKGAAMDFANGLGYGIAGGGVISGIAAVSGKSLTSGLGEVADLGKKAVSEASYYKAQASDMAKQLAEKKFEPILNREEKKEDPELEGPKDWGQTLDHEDNPMIL